MGEADRHAQGAVEVLVNVADAKAVAGGFRVRDRAQRIALAAHVHCHGALAECQRTHGLHVNRAGQTLADQARVRSFVNGDAAQQLGRVLVEFDAAIVAGADLLAAVQQGGREVGGQAAHADDLGTAADALGRQAWQARDRLGDADVRKLANIFGRDGFDDRGGGLLDRDCVFDTAANAGYRYRCDRRIGRLATGCRLRIDITGHRRKEHGAACGYRAQLEYKAARGLAGSVLVREIFHLCLLSSEIHNPVALEADFTGAMGKRSQDVLMPILY